MKQFNIIYKILKRLSNAMDIEEFDSQLVSYEALGISKTMWENIIKLLLQSGYIAGVEITQTIIDDEPTININDISITLKGLEYLEENSMMKKAYRTAKGIKEIIK